MFRYLARRYDRKHIERSLQRQKRIHHRNIGFRYEKPTPFTTMDFMEEFFSSVSPAIPLDVEGESVIFESDIKTPEKENNIFECLVTDSGEKDHAIVVFHHWYARNRYPSFSKFFASRGITVVEVSLPYHFSRSSDDYSEEKLLSADVDLTLQSVRQAVLDGRKVVQWLRSEGYYKISVVGMCIGGLIAGLVAAQEPLVSKAVLMVAPSRPAELVWSAVTLQGLRARIEPHLSLDELKEAWGLIDLTNHNWWLYQKKVELMFVLGKDDTIVCSDVSDGVANWNTEEAQFYREGYARDGLMLNHQVVRLNCGHSSIGMFPYNLMAARKVLRFLKDTPTLAELWDMRGFRYDFSEVPYRRTRWGFFK